MKLASERFWSKVSKSNDCWIWTGAKTKNGYGVFQKGRRGELLYKAHRFSFEIHKGEIPTGMIIMHQCDNKICVNPDHLTAGNHSQNLKDAWDRNLRSMTRKNRKAIGEMSKKLSFEDVQKIKELRSYGQTLKSIGNQFNVSLSNVHNIITGKTWKTTHEI